MSSSKAQQTPWLQRKLEAIWYQNDSSLLFYLLLPLSALFCFLGKVRRKKSESQQEPLPIPIIVVGNISVGGTGKTPLVIKLTELLKNDKDNNYNPAIITRGYKGTASTWPLHVKPTTKTQLSGDEAKLMAIRTKVPVIAGANRVDDIQYVLANTNCNIIISDDGLQHYRMKRDIEIVVIDAQRRFGNGHCLPAGPLRELPDRLTECDFVITNGQPALLDQNMKTENIMQVSGTELINISTNKKCPLTSFQAVQVVTGIGNPQRFINTLEASGLTLSNSHLFPDHHHFVVEDFDQHSDIPIVMTEKDAVKCIELGLQNCWYLPVDAKLEQTFETNFLNKVAESFNQSLGQNLNQSFDQNT